MKGYEYHGTTDFVLCLGYKGWLIKEFFLNYRAKVSDLRVRLGTKEAVRFFQPPAEDWSVTLAETGDETMTAGRIAAIRSYVQDDDVFFLTYGDGVSDVDITKLLDFHLKSGAVVTVTAVRPPGRFGELQVGDGRVVQFNEKPQAAGGLINGGFFVCDAKRIWPYLGDEATVFEREPLRQLAADRLLTAYVHDGFWQPMDTLREFELLNEMWVSGEAPWAKWKARE
jgi:glucose-1-phosphate cytidylyltransferase